MIFQDLTPGRCIEIILTLTQIFIVSRSHTTFLSACVFVGLGNSANYLFFGRIWCISHSFISGDVRATLHVQA